MDYKDIVRSIGTYATQGIAVGAADPDDGAVLTFVWINQAFTHITGFKPSNIYGQTAGRLAGEAADPSVHLRIIRRMQAWETFTERLRLTHADGRTYWGELTFRPVLSDDSTPHWVLLIQDISGMMADRAHMSDLSLVAQTTTDMVCLIDRRLMISWSNAAFAGIFNATPDRLRTRHIFDVLAPNRTELPDVEKVSQTLRSGRDVTTRFMMNTGQDDPLTVEARFAPICDTDQQHTDGHMVTLRDVSHQAKEESWSSAIFRQSDLAIAVSDGKTFLSGNENFAQLCNTTVDELIGSKTIDQNATPFLRQITGVFGKVQATGTECQLDQQVPGPDAAADRSLQTRVFRSIDSTTNQPFLCIVSTDVTRIRQTEAKLGAAQREMHRLQTRLFSAIDASPDGTILCDLSDQIVHASRAFRELHGRFAEQITPGMSYKTLVDLGVASGLWDTGGMRSADWVAKHLADRADGSLHDRMIPMADNRWMLCREVKLKNGERMSLRIDATGMKADKDRLFAAQKAAEMAESRLTAAFEALEDEVLIFDSEDRLAITNSPSGQNDIVFSPPEKIGRTFEDLLRERVASGVFKQAIGREGAFIADRVKKHRDPGVPIEQEFTDGRVFKIAERRTSQGDTVALAIDLTHEYSQRRALEGYAEELRSNHELLQQRNRALQRAQNALEHSSLHDTLTDLPNRRYFDHSFRRCVAECSAGKGFGLLHVDLDGFKRINDSYGHAVGDQVLVSVAALLRSMANEDLFIARVGGDEFILLGTSDADVLELGDLAEAVIGRLSEPIRVGAIECRIGASIGIAIAPPGAGEEETKRLPIKADTALYEAKRQGRNRWILFSDDLQARSLRRQQLTDALLQAIANDQIEVYYQPQVRASDEKLVGVEALLRWKDVELGQIQPQKFLQIAEEIGVAADLDRLMFHKIAKHDEGWRADGVTIPKIALNCTGRRLRSPQLVEDIQKCGMSPKRLTIEVLETIFIDVDDRVLTWNIDQLRELGASIALDDFGTGHSSIVGVLKLKPHALKIDKAFVDQALGVREAEILIESVISIGKTLGLEVVAEGIESRSQAERLSQMGCDTLQGYAFGPPMTSTEIFELFRAQQPRVLP